MSESQRASEKGESIKMKMSAPTKSERLPQIEVFSRVLGLPVIERALDKSASTYFCVKDCNQIVHWVFSTAENSIYNATKQVMPIAAPIAKKFSTGIEYVDHKLCMGLDKIEEKIPIVKESPEQIFEKSYMFAIQTVQPAVATISYANYIICSQAESLKMISWNKANQILNTQYGIAAVNQLDNTALILHKLIDRYFPATGGDELVADSSSCEEDKLLHTLQTIGKLSNTAARRVCSHVVKNLQTLNSNNVKIYITNVVEFLQISHYLHTLNNKVQQLTDPPKKTLKTNGCKEASNGHVKSE